MRADIWKSSLFDDTLPKNEDTYVDRKKQEKQSGLFS
jgi:hypothetical protein